MGTVRSTGIYMFKWTDEAGQCYGGGRAFKYDLPKDGKPGKWHTKKDPTKVSVCEYGFHCVASNNINNYRSYGPRLFLVEVSGAFEVNHNGDKVACQSIRFIKELSVNHDKEGNWYFVGKLSFGHVKELINYKIGKLGIDIVGKI